MFGKKVKVPHPYYGLIRVYAAKVIPVEDFCRGDFYNLVRVSALTFMDLASKRDIYEMRCKDVSYFYLVDDFVVYVVRQPLNQKVSREPATGRGL